MIMTDNNWARPDYINPPVKQIPFPTIIFGYSVELPAGWFIPQSSSDTALDHYFSFSARYFSSHLCFRRVDTLDEDILYKARANSAKSPFCKIGCLESKYRSGALELPAGFTARTKGTIQLVNGFVDFVSTEHPQNDIIQRRYFSLYYLENNWLGFILYAEQLIQWHKSSIMFIQEKNGLSAQLLEILSSLKKAEKMTVAPK